MNSISEKLVEAEAVLRTGGIAESRREASLLISLAIGKDKTFLIAHPEYLLDASEADILEQFVKRRAAHEPYQYIAGRQEFYGLDFLVTPDVLIPRPETEMIVERAIEVLGSKSGASICEVGVGSGCIAISILYHAPTASALGVDASTAALEVARHNAERLGVANRLTLVRSDIYSSLEGQKFELIVSNPPYIPMADRDGLQPEVRDFEPNQALFGGEDGLDLIRRIVDGAPRFLDSGGQLLMEIGFGQSEKVADLFDRETWREPEFVADLQGIPRLVIGELI